MLGWNLLKTKSCLDQKTLNIFISIESYLEVLPRNEFNRMLYYVGACEYAGFCKDGNSRRLCADRWIAGKRKVSAPGTKRRKKEVKERKKLLANLSDSFKTILEDVCRSEEAQMYKRGNQKALNSCVGMIMKQTREIPPAAVKELLERRLND